MVAQFGEARFVVDCRLNPGAFIGHVKMTFVPAGVIVSNGAPTAPATVRLNTVPSSKLPPLDAVPYKVLPDKMTLETGLAPSKFVNVFGSKALNV